MTAIAGTILSFRSMADGTLRLTVGLNEAESRQALSLLCDVGAAVAIARLVDNHCHEPVIPDGDNIIGYQGLPHLPTELKAPYGQQAKALRLSGFFLQQVVWKAVGRDAEFLEWLKAQRCAAISLEWNSDQHCHGDVVAAHVRRITNGAGTGIKPSYSAIPLCDAHHQMQHRAGEAALGGKEWFDKQRIEYVQRWCWETLKAQLGYAHWNLVPPQVLAEWADKNGVNTHLPVEYKA